MITHQQRVSFRTNSPLDSRKLAQLTISTTHARHTTQWKLADVNRFIQQFERGHGDYTVERDRLLGNPTVDELVKKIEQRRKMNQL